MKNSQNNDPNWINLKCGNLQLQGNATTLCSAGCILALASLAVYKGFLWVKHSSSKADDFTTSGDTTNNATKNVSTPDNEHSLTWTEAFHEKHTMPKLPPFLKQILDGCPKGYEDAMMLALLTELGALCFSKVRSVYLDGVMHSASLLCIIEAPFGAGKGKFETLYKHLFARLIKADEKKLSEDSGDSIVQNMGINTSQAKFYDVTAANQGVHQFILETEIATATAVLKKPNGLSYEHLRKAFENGCVFQNNKAKHAATGSFPVYLNCVFTGTHDAVETFIGKEIEGGTASRFVWSTFPESGREIATLKMPQGEDLEKIRNQIDEWHDKYCYHSNNGKDSACEETIIELGYVEDALENWTSLQYDKFELDGDSARVDIRSRAAAIAFHAAIVIHMLWEQPKKEDAKRQAVVDLAIYIADYCTERFIHKFGKIHNSQREANRSAEYVKPEQQDPQPQSTVTIKGVPLDVALQMYNWYRRGVNGHGYNSIVRNENWSKRYGLDSAQQVKRLFEEMKKLGYIS